MSSKQNTRQQKQLHVGAQTIPYTLTYTQRKTVGITIHPDLRVEVRAPAAISDQAVEEIIQKRAAWILRHLEELAQRLAKQPPSIKAQGASYQFLGCQLPIILEPTLEAASVGERVILENSALHVYVKNRGVGDKKSAQDKKQVDALLEKWSREQAKSIFTIRTTKLLVKFKELRLQCPELAIRRMKARWGSCSADGTITLNLNLIHLDPALIDYVIMHELCHLIEHNHSKHYYALLTHMMPDWSERRQRLNEIGMPE
jgi:predicted metal-dependent hydrolase